ncbi:sialate O-acetylesterase [Galbibacter sp.]|uniref:sialate O-acetylesterase n=1 Tax=Galbibacter sp. TaxID=2918471 RepID=UPI002B8F43F6|nr:sialate O-acetylesterase [Galbibacter sp.]HLV62164.1 sialate O-acetylesterase [Galbibacter sp.]
MKSLQITCLLFICSINAYCQLELPKLISDGMVLQREIPLKIWGWSKSQDTIEIKFNNSNYQAIADNTGNWATTLPPIEAGGPFQMTISSSDSSVTIEDILIGDVWLCSGQSNMEISLDRTSPIYPKEIKNANFNNIRYFEVPKTYNFKAPQKRIEGGQWTKTTPETVLKFSAVAYFFAHEIHNSYNIPIGLINAALGGSPVNAWLSEKALKKFPEAHKQYKIFQQDHYVDSIKLADQKRIQNWYQSVNTRDRGTIDHWEAKNLHIENWDKIQMPGFWTTTYPELQQGVVWLRKEFEISKASSGKEAKLLLGTIVDADSVFINGNYVGHTTYQYPPRRYTIAKNLLKEGINTIAIKVINERGHGGFTPEKDYKIVVGNQEVDLKGTWRIRQGAKATPLAGQTFVRWEPGGLYNAMIAPLLKYRIKGTLWYQGESDTDEPEKYQELFTTLIKTWREDWNQGEFPFLYVQLANFMKAKNQPSQSNWAALRDAQLQSLEVDNTAMAVAIDIGEWNDIHPLNKKDVGHRLALAAKHLAYGEKNIIYSGPQFKSQRIDGQKIILSFDHIGSGLTSKGRLKEFAIAGEDKKFVWAKAEIKGDKIEVWSPEITHPKYVRYAWADNPEHANLYNEQGLPASPFKTD